ncbi:hypothetical protein [Clostridium thermarum]|uniref:hypothetical protein n=1 Tax=Clostridium thermarum TaxID=1716543 RepID=UPI001120DE23|nr:hypothetical protein [Clostridium thermarum]
MDQRLEHNYCIGAKYFIEKLKPKFLIPMHFGEVYETTSKFKAETEAKNTKIIEIEKKGQEFRLTVESINR